MLVAAVQAGQQSRIADCALLKTLGASRRFVLLAQSAEFTVLGLLAGVLGSVGAIVTGWAIAFWVLNLPYWPDPWIPVIGIVFGISMFTALGLWNTRQTLRASVVESLRSTL